MLSGILFLDKPLGWSSRRAVNEVIRLFTPVGMKKIKAGHAGTLDPLATGMLPILLGDATRFAELGLNAEKMYRFTLDLSYQTDSLDCEGEVVGKFDATIDEKELLKVIESFAGEQEQMPPIYSAIRVDGKRAHELARKGKDVTLTARPVTIHQLELIHFEFPKATLRVSCSKGTYVRSLARDIGEKLGMGGCVTQLRRLSTGGWPEAMMVSIEEATEKREASILPLAIWLREFPDLTLSPEEGRRFLQGQRIQVSDRRAGPVKVFADNELLGTAELKQGMNCMVLHPSKILPSAQERLL
ncbi:MAG TPA: tRNA pseudouridine(55) synthase TruB [Mariprofundaceae bacterium]|nr:tRNA pseudouridine(55) synthase TruB [Mariprofundaceae bacterium]